MDRVGTVYGQGLYTLAKEEGLESAVLEQLQVLDGSFQSQPDYLRLLALRNLSKDERIGILNDGFADKLHPYALNFLKLLTEKGYIRQFSDCCKAYIKEYNADKGILEVKAVSAVALSDAQKTKLADKLTAMTGKQVTLTCKVDAAVLGGVRLQFDGQQVDGTVQNRLQEMEKMLKNTVL